MSNAQTYTAEEVDLAAAQARVEAADEIAEMIRGRYGLDGGTYETVYDDILEMRDGYEREARELD